MKKLLLIVVCLFASVSCVFAQTDNSEEFAVIEEASGEDPFVVVEKMPEFVGGKAKLGKFIKANLKYPDEARKAGVSGKVFLNFTVTADGSITDIHIMRGLGHGCEEEAIRLVKSMPKWKPGMQSGKKVPVQYSMFVSFTPDAKK